MSLTALIQSSVNKAFEALGDLKDTVVYTAPGSTYDPATGTITTGTDYTVTDAVVSAFRTRDVDGTVIQQGDRQVVINASDIAVEPVSGGKLTIGSDVYQIIDCVPDPAGASYTLQVRR